MLGHLWERLVAAGLLHDLLSVGIATVVGHVVLWRPWRAHRRTQKLIADRLGTSTPGGMTDVAAKGKGAGNGPA